MQTEPTSPKATILIVDDEESVRAILRDILADQAYHFVFAGDGDDAMSKVAGEQPDLILLDLSMPRVNGLEVCLNLKNANSPFRHIPIILVTGFSSEHDLAAGIAAGADDFIRKPASAIELRARVKSMLRVKHQYDRLADALQMREDLANMLVHDMRTPLTVILGSAQRLQRYSTKFDDPKLDRSLGRVFKQARKLESMVNDLLLLAKTEGSQLRLNRLLNPIDQCLDNAVQNHQSLAAANDIDVQLTVASNLPDVDIDLAMFQRVLDNLLSNAIKFSPAGEPVKLTAVTHNGGIRLTVEDYGPGIPDEYKALIFDKFEIVAMKKQGVTQVGLGLAFCAMVAQAHNHILYVQDNQPQGSVFVLEIPAVQEGRALD